MKSWDSFDDVLKRVRREYGIYRRELPNGQVFERKVGILFRGQADHRWKLEPESVTPEPATAWLAPMASKIAVHRPFGAAALLPWCVGRLS